MPYNLTGQNIYQSNKQFSDIPIINNKLSPSSSFKHNIIKDKKDNRLFTVSNRTEPVLQIARDKAKDVNSDH